MAKQEFDTLGFLLRWLGAMVLVFATFNPSGYSYIHWAVIPLAEFSVFKLFCGVVLLIGWAIYLRATLQSLGAFGLLLAFAFFGTLIWLIVDVGILPANSMMAVNYLVLVVFSAVLAVGMSWAHIRRRLSGQVTTDEIDEQ